jgi:hypothetical protein
LLSLVAVAAAKVEVVLVVIVLQLLEKVLELELLLKLAFHLPLEPTMSQQSAQEAQALQMEHLQAPADLTQFLTL